MSEEVNETDSKEGLSKDNLGNSAITHIDNKHVNKKVKKFEN